MQKQFRNILLLTSLILTPFMTLFSPMASAADSMYPAVYDDLPPAPDASELPFIETPTQPTEAEQAPPQVIPQAQAETNPRAATDSFSAGGTQGTVNASKVNIRSGPNSDRYEIVTTLPEGSTLTIVGQNQDQSWYIIKYPAQHACYIQASSIEGSLNGAISSEGVAMTVKKDSASLHVRPWEKSTVVGSVTEGDVVTVLGRQGDFYKIFAPETAQAWVSAKYVSTTNDAKNLPEKMAPEPGVIGNSGKTTVVKEAVRTTTEDTDSQPRKSSLLYERIERAMSALPQEVPAVDPEVERAERLAEIKKRMEVITTSTELEKKSLSDQAQEWQKLSADKRFYSGGFVSGWVEYIGEGIRRPAAYRLVNGNEVVFLLRSSEFDLHKYVNKRISVNGRVEMAPGWDANVLIVEQLKLFDDGPYFDRGTPRVDTALEVVPHARNEGSRLLESQEAVGSQGRSPSMKREPIREVSDDESELVPVR